MPNPMVSGEYKIYIVVYIITVKSDLLWSEWTLSGHSWAMLDVKKKKQTWQRTDYPQKFSVL